MEGLIEQHDDVRLRRIDIGSWDSAVARAHGIRRLPSLVLYDGEECVSTDTRDVLRRLSER